MEQIQFKEDKCARCREAIRQEIIQEIHEDAGCLKCANLYRALNEPDTKPILHREHGVLKASGRRRV